MKPVSRVLLSSLALGVALSLCASAQWNKKPYTEWSEKEALKVLNDSQWRQTQAVTDTFQMTGQARANSSQSRHSSSSPYKIKDMMFDPKLEI